MARRCSAVRAVPGRRRGGVPDRARWHAAQASFELPKFHGFASTISGGVNNVFDAGPPVCVSCSLNGYDASNYDIAGRFGYVQATVKF